MVAPPPRPPLPAAATPRRPRRSTLRLHCPRWVLEAGAAVTLLAVMAAVFSPSPSRPAPSAGPRPAQTWEAHHARALTNLARDIAAAQKAITSGPNRARGGPAPAVARLGADLARLRSQPEPPDPALGRAWDSALSDASAAVGLLARDTPLAPSRTAATARSDLEAAGESVVAVIQAARSPRVAYPH